MTDDLTALIAAVREQTAELRAIRTDLQARDEMLEGLRADLARRSKRDHDQERRASVGGAAPKAPAQQAMSTGGAVFPPYGRRKGEPVTGATLADLTYYREGCNRTLCDEAKKRWWPKEEALLAAIDAEIARQEGTPPRTGGGSSESTGFGPPSFEGERPPPDDDIPFATSAGIR